MDETQLKECIKTYIKENLRVEVDFDPSDDYYTIKILLDGEWVSDCSFKP